MRLGGGQMCPRQGQDAWPYPPIPAHLCRSSGIAQAFRSQSDSTCNKVGNLVSRNPSSNRRRMRALSTDGRRGGKSNHVILR